MQNIDNISGAFTRIYDDNVWGKGSGTGSMAVNNIDYIAFISNFIRRNKISSVLDFGCGDWQFSQFVDWSGLDYTGVDVVESVITRNSELFAAPNIRFMTYSDIAALPSVDLVLSKDVMQHLPLAAVKQAIATLRTKAKLLLITNDIFPDKWTNVEIEPGGGRAIRLYEEPFNEKGAVIYRSAFIAYEAFVEKEAFLMMGDRT